MTQPLRHKGIVERGAARHKMAIAGDPPFVIGRAAWWMPVAVTQQYKRVPFTEALRDFLYNVSFHCYSKLVEPRRRFHERLFWFVFHVSMFTVLLAFLSDTVTFDQDFLSTNLYDPLYPIRKVAFPTFSICSLNRISNAAATSYAEELHMKDPFRRGVDYFYNHLKKMNWPYYNGDSVDSYEDLLEFQNYLDIYDTTDADFFYDTRDRMRKLTPTCDEIFIRCRLSNEDIDCDANFKQTLTANGFCCTFNHDGLYSHPRSQELSFFKHKGLTVLLNVSHNDYFYKQFMSADFGFYFHEYGNFADVLSGSVNERLVGGGMKTTLSVDARITETVKNARILGPNVRNCYFADEQPRIYGKQYSLNNCITRCRVHSIFVLCDCLLFVYPEELLEVDTDFVYCTLRHRPCLQRYAFKWSNVITERENIPGLEHEMEDALYCPQCLPPCSWTSYDVNTNALPLTGHDQQTFEEIGQMNVSDLALATIGFGKSHVQFHKRMLKDSWVEVFSLVGSIVGITTGFSLVGICELIYFFAYQLVMSFKREMASDRKGKKQKPKKPLLILP